MLEVSQARATPSNLETGMVTGGVKWILQAEGLAAMILAVGLYGHFGSSWWLFTALFFVPDVSFSGYLISSRIGAIGYNIFHSYISAATLSLIAYGVGNHLILSISFIWVAHIGFDRSLGFGLKYQNGFSFTHLG